MQKALYRAGILKFSKDKLKNWFAKRDADKLILALCNGNFRIRTIAANLLGALKDEKAIPYLKNGIDDKVEIASFASINALLKIGIDNELRKDVNEKIEYWELKKTSKYKIRAERTEKKKIHKWNKKDRMRNLEKVKQMFKRPKK